jgi:hypothetical protein
MKLRTGRHLGPTPGPSTIYMQLGSEPSDKDVWLGVIFDPSVADRLVWLVNHADLPA